VPIPMMNHRRLAERGGLHVFRSEGIKRKLASSRKTRWAANLAVFFYRDRRIASISRWPLHCAHWPDVPASPIWVEEFPPTWRSIRSAVRCVVCSSVRYSWAMATLVRRRTRRACCCEVIRGGRPVRRGFGLQRVFSAILERNATLKDIACVTPHAADNLMKGQLLGEEGDAMLPTRFQGLWKTMSSQRDFPFSECLQDIALLMRISIRLSSVLST